MNYMGKNLYNEYVSDQNRKAALVLFEKCRNQIGTCCRRLTTYGEAD